VTAAGRLLIGMDLVEIERIARALDRWGGRFLDRIFLAEEIDQRRIHPAALAQHVAGRFAAKEAAMKALGTGWRGVAFRDICVGRERSGKPRLDFGGRARLRAEALHVRQAEVTITHTAATAAAFVALVCG
jgi:holo-[acyl-carrier protein] synthase